MFKCKNSIIFLLRHVNLLMLENWHLVTGPYQDVFGWLKTACQSMLSINVAEVDNRLVAS